MERIRIHSKQKDAIEVFPSNFIDPRYFADENDWIALQGGKPIIRHKKGELYTIVHNYQNRHGGTGAVVPTFNPKSYGTIRLLINNHTIEVPIALVWKFHGLPCELRSQTPYSRIKI